MSGHDSASDFIIAALLAWLKSDHMAAGPVRRTVTPAPGQPGETVLEPARRLDHLRRRCTREPGDDRGAAVARDGDARLRRQHAAHGRGRCAGPTRTPASAARIGRSLDPGALAGHDHGQRIRPLPGEMRLDRAASLA